ncbi:MAG: N-acetyltransferase family protein [Pyrinomonadaceae bacterium]
MPVRSATSNDAAAVAEIYNYYIANSHATFELDSIDAAEMLRRIESGWSGEYPFMVYEEDGEVLGYAYGHQYKPRKAYEYSIEVSVYVRNGHEGGSIGTRLYEQLFAEIGRGDFHAIIAGISLPNEASIRLHEKFGFEKVAHFREVGFKFDRWIDVGYWEKIVNSRK